MLNLNTLLKTTKLVIVGKKLKTIRHNKCSPLVDLELKSLKVIKMRSYRLTACEVFVGVNAAYSRVPSVECDNKNNCFVRGRGKVSGARRATAGYGAFFVGGRQIQIYTRTMNLILPCRPV